MLIQGSVVDDRESMVGGAKESVYQDGPDSYFSKYLKDVVMEPVAEYR